MPQEYAEGRTTDPETWTTSPERLAFFAKLAANTEARSRSLADAAVGRRALAGGELGGPVPEPAVGSRRLEHGRPQQPGQGQHQGWGGVQP
ncbi:hypothetical protein GCM10010232_62290 [Streptomyces amakusaensis]|uniref:Uncharacterized protein n=1 Tax=Streptomyces amakusaensis TaxID=67271 RepID=A0ABW0AQD7_9ACTN